MANELDPATERIIDHLQDQYSVPISFELFQSFRDGDREFLIRSRKGELDPFATNGNLQSTVEQGMER